VNLAMTLNTPSLGAGLCPAGLAIVVLIDFKDDVHY
jgi:hypothetical protein